MNSSAKICYKAIAGSSESSILSPLIVVGDAHPPLNVQSPPDHFFFLLTRAVGITEEWPCAPWRTVWLGSD